MVEYGLPPIRLPYKGIENRSEVTRRLTIREAAQLSGEVVASPFDTSVGRTAVLADPQGAGFSVSKAGPVAERESRCHDAPGS